MIGENLLRFQYKQKYLCFDTETASLNLLLNNPPTELGYQIYEGNKLIKSVVEYPWSDKVEENMSKDAARITRFDFQEYKSKATDSKTVLEKFEKYLYDPEYLIVGANTGNFDYYVLNQWRRELGKPSDFSYFRRNLDIQNFQKAKVLEIPIPPILTAEYESFQWKMYGFRRRGLKTNVGFLCKEFGINYDTNFAHSSEFDIGVTFEIFQKQIKSQEIGF